MPNLIGSLLEKGVPQTEDEGEKKTPGFVLNNVAILNGEFDGIDQKTGVTHTIKDFFLDLPFLSSRLNHLHETSRMDIQFILNGTPCHIQVESTPFAQDLSTRINFRFSDMDLIHYLAYLPLPESLQIKTLGLDADVHGSLSRQDSGLAFLLNGTAAASHARVTGKTDETIFSFSSLEMDLSNSDILSGQLNFSKILLLSPKLNLERDITGNLIFPDFKGPNALEKKEKQGQGIPFKAMVADLGIKKAEIAFKDRSNRVPFESTISPLDMNITRLKIEDTISGEYTLNLKTLAHETLGSKGEFQTRPFKINGSLSLDNVFFNQYSPYYQDHVHFDIKDGSLDLSAEFEIFEAEKGYQVMVNTGECEVHSLGITDRRSGQEFFHIPELSISGSVFDLTDKKLDIGAIVSQKGKILVQRDKKGRLNLVENFILARAPHTKEQGEISSLPWAVTLDEFDAGGFSLVFTDLKPRDPVNLEFFDISIKAGAFDTSGREPGKMDARMKWGKDGQIHINGDMSLADQTAGLDVVLEKIDIRMLQPYFTDELRIMVSKGDISAKGRLTADMKSSAEKQIRFAGETSVTDFASRDKKTATDFFNCNSLYLDGIDLALFPLKIKAKEISLTDFYSRIIVSDTGQLNVTAVLKPDSPMAGLPDAGKKGPDPVKPEITIDNITLQGGFIEFTDYLTQPNFNGSMKEIAGFMTGISSEEQSRAKIHLQGIHGYASPLEITGEINLLTQQKFAAVDIVFNDIELTNFTPYSSKYLGYKIEKGTLILDLTYTIEGNTLKSKNRISFDNFHLGEKVDSKHATTLPIGLAIALLKNRDGRIDLDLPVAGKLDDPEFRLGSVILKMVSNLILKVITSPFSVIGAMFGSGEELGYVDFEFGDPKIKEADHEKIDTLAEILDKKPSVKIEIQGTYDRVRDAQGIRTNRFEILMKEYKKSSLAGTMVLDEVILTPEDRDVYIEKAYEQAEFSKPRDENGIEKKLDTEEKIKLLITHISIDENDLRALAVTRSENIRTYLISSGKVEKGSIFLLEPVENKEEGQAQTSRVNFSLR